MTANLDTGSPAPPETGSTPRSRWETIVWPPWLPVRARLPLIAQIAGASALIAALAMPQWADVAKTPAAAAAPTSAVPPAAAVAPKPVVPKTATRPAHLNLDVRHAFRSIDLSVTVDGRSVLDTTVEGSGKRFKVFGKRAERGYTTSLNLSPGVRVVRVRVRSAADKFDHTRVERFDLDSASVATLQIAADRAGLSVVAERPPAPERAPAPPATQVTQVAQATQATQVAQAAQVAQAQQASALAELYQSLRSILIAVAGFIGSAATGFVVQEFLRSRKQVMGR
ncbi:MAG: hypothetical protein Q7R30_17590 [Acidobacteriota bacterium]|nr:hypothetical protein [Acidobacteriota bacterium]